MMDIRGTRPERHGIANPSSRLREIPQDSGLPAVEEAPEERCSKPLFVELWHETAAWDGIPGIGDEVPGWTRLIAQQTTHRPNTPGGGV
jgi:hypothetical protein